MSPLQKFFAFATSWLVQLADLQNIAVMGRLCAQRADLCRNGVVMLLPDCVTVEFRVVLPARSNVDINIQSSQAKSLSSRAISMAVSLTRLHFTFFFLVVQEYIQVDFLRVW